MHNKFTGEIDAVRTALRQFDCRRTSRCAFTLPLLTPICAPHQKATMIRFSAKVLHSACTTWLNLFAIQGTDAVLSGAYFVRESCTSRYSLKSMATRIPLELVGAGALQGNSACSLCHDV